MINWSETHEATASTRWTPRNEEELVYLLREHCSKPNRKCRPVGTGLSPNGVAFPDPGHDSISMANFDSIRISNDRSTVTCGSGVRVEHLLDVLHKEGLTLENFSSIKEQQVAGWTQVASHGTGSRLSTVDDMIQNMRIVFPVDASASFLSKEVNPELFSMAKVSLGALGVVTELTLRCIPQFSLREKTSAVHRAEALANIDEHYSLLRNNRHVRYMWIPFTDTVVRVVSNPVPERSAEAIAEHANVIRENELLRAKLPFIYLIDDILSSSCCSSSSPSACSGRSMSQLSFASLRDVALSARPTTLTNVKQVNAAEAAYWEAVASSSTLSVREADSVDILGFDCGGHQLVMEVCFSIGSLEEQTGRDLTFMKEIVKALEAAGVAAPAPIEQRWTSRSTSRMSPAYSEREDEVFCWVGIIMYMPHDQTPEQRNATKRDFERYCDVIQPLCAAYGATPHWGKLETRGVDDERRATAVPLANRYPLDKFRDLRKLKDPNACLSNRTVDDILSDAASS